MSERIYKTVCHCCDWRGMASDLLRAPSPFDPTDELVACPNCKQLDELIVACDEDGCWREATCGTPVDGGYRQTCFDHAPK